jgi:parvulin-like peptidyl-prolyl isomerase
MKPAYRAAIAAAVIVAAGCSPSKTNVATVNGKEISNQQLAEYMEKGPEAQAALRTLILESMLQDEAAKAGASVSDTDISNYLQARKDQVPPGRFEEAMASEGTTDARIRRDARIELLRRAIEIKDAKVSPESIKKQYDTDTQNVYSRPEWVQIGTIITKDKTDALNAADALKQGAGFPETATKFSVPQARQQSTQLQWIGIVKGGLVDERHRPISQLDPAITAAIKKTPQGQASAPIGIAKTAYQRLFYIAKRVPGGKIPLDEVKADIAYSIAASNNQLKTNTMDDLVKNAKIEIPSDQFKGILGPDGHLRTATQAPVQQ